MAALFCECVFHVPVPESGNLCVPVFCLGSLPVFTKKSVSQKLVYRGISAGGGFMVCFIRSDSNGVRRGKGRCEGDAVRANAAVGAHIS